MTLLFSSGDREPPKQLAIYGAENQELAGLIAEACDRAGWLATFDHGHDASAMLHVVYPDDDSPELPQTSVAGHPLQHAIVCVRRRYERLLVHAPAFTWIDVGAEDPLITEQVFQWLTGIDRSLADPGRAAIEALYRTIQLGLIENDHLKALIADLTAELAGVTGQLTEAQMEIRTLEGLHAQLEKQNEALLKELSKGRVQPESASLLARGIKFGAVSLVSLAITVGGTYAGTKAALPEEQVAQLQQTQQVIVNQCDQVIQVVGSGD